MIDEDLKAWLIEINNAPSMSYLICTGGRGCKHVNCYESPVNKIVKKILVHDCFELLVAGREAGGFNNMGERFKALTKVHPNDDPRLK